METSWAGYKFVIVFKVFNQDSHLRGESHRKAGGAPTSKSFYGFFLRHTSYFVIVHEQVVSEFPKFLETVLTFSSKQPLLEGMCTGFFII